MIPTLPVAEVRVRRRDDRLPGLLHIIVACPAVTTVFPHVPAPESAPLTIELSVTLVALQHGQACGSCDLAAVHAKGSGWLANAVLDVVRGADERAVGSAARDRLPANRRN